MVVGQCQHQRTSESVAEGGRLALSSGCPSRENGFSSSRLYMCAATRPFSSLRASSASPCPKQLADPSDSLNTAKLSSRRTFSEPAVDEDGYLCSPRAARELAFSILYAALRLGERPMRVFKDRLKQQSGYLAKDLIARYKHAPDVGGSIVVEDALSARKLEDEQLGESLLEAAVLSAPPSKVYKRSILMMAQEIIKVTADTWTEHDLILSDLLPELWQERGGHAAIQQCILHMSMAEMTRCRTPPKVVISEAMELGERFMDVRSARVIHGCLGSFTESAYYKDRQNEVNRQ
ncbi:hypothetical protein GOP47_0020639 [Adiantum capillus-veneris]|uniref:NusB/RsmB/TIM44 domain-containing protein n=1 Tax=Adiantum capillus-veneris TaxID=13818 RepID=A0A9D4Z759_ADICA|nr:hypothetical protein GOP47_0020639 [Adiantum capillus-veneris]